MSFPAAFLTFMPYTVVVRGLVSVDAYGKATYTASGSTYRCMIEERPQLVRTTWGEEVIASHVVYVASTGRLDPTSQFTLPAGYDTELSLIRANVFSDPDGIHHNELFFGPASA